MDLNISQNERPKVTTKRDACLSLKDLSKNRRMVFGHDIGSLQSTQPFEFFYNERALIIANKADTVLLNRAVDPSYIQYMKSIGIGPEQIVVFNSQNIYEGVKSLPSKPENATYSPFISKKVDKLVQEKLTTHYIGNPEHITNKYYDKTQFKTICTSLGIKTAPGSIFVRTDSPQKDQKNLQYLLDSALSLNGEAILRHATGEAGSDIFIVNKDTKYDVMQKVLNGTGNYVVESKLEVTKSPCVLGFIDRKGPTLAAVSSQVLLNGIEYNGSIINYEKSVDKAVYDSFIKLGTKMHKDGYRGPFGIDYIYTKDGDIMPCECNARVNGSFYPHELRQNLLRKGHTFNYIVTSNIKVPQYNTFSGLVQNKGVTNLLYKGTDKPGILPYNVTSLTGGKLYYVILANNAEEAKRLSTGLKKALS